MTRTLGFIFITLGFLLAFFILYKNSRYSSTTRTFSAYSFITSSWTKYKQKFLNFDGRILDHSNNDLTTSEGQSYAMLRAVWTDDKPTFDLLWKWTKDNLKRPNDHLLGWRWGQQPDGHYGFFPNGGDNSATDADSDIALSLLYASRRWNDPHYQDEALPLISDIYKYETDTSQGKRYLVAGNWAQGSSELVINPSYFSPYAWRVFAQVDKQDDWLSLINPAYELLNQAGDLPPDWLAIDRQTGTIKAPSQAQLSQNYSYDAMRVPWRIYLDYQFNQEPQAAQYLQSHFQTLKNEYTQSHYLSSGYTHDGHQLTNYESPVMYATALGYFMLTDPKTADEIYQNKILKLYSNSLDTFNDNLPYYEQNWLWFGAALKEQFLINLWK